jgi:hypothetical protein
MFCVYEDPILGAIDKVVRLTLFGQINEGMYPADVT